MTRSAVECRITWLSNKSPTVNHSDWSQPELHQLAGLVADYELRQEAINWVSVAQQLGVCRMSIGDMITKLAHNRLAGFLLTACGVEPLLHGMSGLRRLTEF